MLDQIFRDGEGINVATKSLDLKDFTAATFTSVAQATQWLEKFGHDKHHWFGPNPVRPETWSKATDSDVVESRYMLCDIDPPKSKDDPQGLDEDKREVCRQEAERLWADLMERAWLNDSGRGFQVIIRIAPDVDRKRFGRWLRQNYHNVDRGVGQDLSRLCRVPGFVNPKTGRTAEVLREPREGMITAAEVAAWLPDWTPEEEFDAEGWDDSPPDAEDMAALRAVPAALRIWKDEENAMYKGDASGRAYGFVCDLLRAGLAPDQVCRLAVALPGDNKLEKQGGDAERYWGKCLYSPAMQALVKERQGEAAEAELLASVPQRCVDEDSAMPAFSPDVLKAAAKLKRESPGGFSDLRRRLKRTKRIQPLTDWDKAVSRALRDLAKAEPAPPPDALVRRMENDRGDFLGWLRPRGNSQQWLPRDQVNVILNDRLGTEHAMSALASAIMQPWTVVNQPFEAKELPDRCWNVSQAQWRVEPSPGEHPTYDQWLRVIGRGLDEGVKRHEWCQRHGVDAGSRYLLYWLACMAQHPFDRVAWLFAYSAAEGTGKSMFWEVINKHLLAGGMAKINRFLSSERAFSGELDGIVLCVVEEENVAQHRQRMHDRAKDLITGDVIDIERKGKDVYQVANTTHVYQSANDPSYMVLKAGDTRVTAWEMAPMLDSERMSKAEMHKRLAEEAPAFLHTLLTLEVPPDGDGRLRVPAVPTLLKESQAEAALSPLALFERQHPHWVGMGDEKLCERFLAHVTKLGEHERFWPRRRILSQLDKLAASDRELRRFALRLLEVPSGEYTPAQLAERIEWDRSLQAFGLQIRKLGERVGGVSRRKSNGVKLVNLSHSRGEFAALRVD